MCQESSPRRNQLEFLVLGFAFELFPILIQPKYQLKQSNMLGQSRRAASVVGCTDIYELEYGCECYEYENWRGSMSVVIASVESRLIKLLKC